jgi:hypothetical protein
MILHAQNLADCTFKDVHNNHSIDGLLEVMVSTGLGDPGSLQSLQADAGYQARYASVRKLRNKLVGHMDRSASLSDLLNDLDALPAQDIFDLVNEVDRAVATAAHSSMPIWGRFVTGNQKFKDPSILQIRGISVRPYH